MDNAVKIDVYFWPIVTAFLFYLLSSMGGTGREMATGTVIGLVFGLVLSFILSRVKERLKLRLGLNYLLAFLWGLIVVGVGYPSLSQGGKVDSTAFYCLIGFSAMPLIGISLFLTFVKWRARSERD